VLVCAVGLATDVAKDGMTTGSYGAQYARKIHPVGHGSVGDKVVPSNVHDTPLACHVECVQRS